MLTRYAAQRFLYRLSQSPRHDGFVLKDATLFAYWTGNPHRPTRDLDMLGYGDPAVSHMREVFQAICQQPVEDDGLLFLSETIKCEKIKEEDEYEGVRVTVDAMLDSARIPLQVDVGFGDVITPEAEQAELPVLLDMPAPKLRAYPRETVVAEKCEAMVHLGLANSRIKDFFDLWYLAAHFDFDGALLVRAVAATFARRGTALPDSVPTALTSEYYATPARQTQWQAFTRKNRLPADQSPSFETIIQVLTQFLMPVLIAAKTGNAFDAKWRYASTDDLSGSFRDWHENERGKK